jgi:predicted dehydrogenase
MQPRRGRAHPNVVVIGAGRMGRIHARAAARAGGHLVGVVDPDLSRARAIGGGAPVARSLEELAPVAADVMHVCTPGDAHAGAVRAALALGAHVVVEKPVAPDAAGTKALLDEAARRSAMLVPVHQFLFQPGVQRILARRERLGTLVRVQFEAASAGADRTGLTPEELVADVLPHPLALFARIVDAPLAELGWTVQRPAPGELRALAPLGEATLEIAVSTRGRPTRARLELTGTSGSAEADLYHGFATFERGTVSRASKAARPFVRSGATLAAAGANLAARAGRRETAYPGLQELVERTYAAAAAGGPPPIAPDETLAVAAARDRLLGAS